MLLTLTLIVGEKAIKESGHANILKAALFLEKLKKTIERYNSRNEIELVYDAVEDVVKGLSDEFQKLFKELQEEKKSFETLGITYDEKAFYDILVSVSGKNIISKTKHLMKNSLN